MLTKTIRKIKYLLKYLILKTIEIEFLFHKKSKKSINKLLIVKIDNIGDFILFSPTLRYYEKLYSNYSITILVKDINEELASRFNSIDNIISFDKQKYNNNLFYRRKLLLKLVKENFEIAVYPTYSREVLGDYLVKTTNAAKKIGFNGDLSNISTQQKEKNNKFYTKLITPSPNVLHEVERNKEFIEKLSKSLIKDISLTLLIQKSEKEFAKNLLRNTEKNQPIITLGIGANSEYRLWPINNFCKLAKILDKEYKAQIILIGGAQDITTGEHLKSKISKNTINIIGKTNIFQTAAVLKLSNIYIGNDSGPLHIASATKTPIIEISCYPIQQQKNHPNSPKRFGPWEVPNIVLQPQLGQSIKDISVEQVSNATVNLLSKMGYNQISNE